MQMSFIVFTISVQNETNLNIVLQGVAREKKRGKLLESVLQISAYT